MVVKMISDTARQHATLHVRIAYVHDDELGAVFLGLSQVIEFFEYSVQLMMSVMDASLSFKNGKIGIGIEPNGACALRLGTKWN
jgi:hypothetical protein